MPRQRQNERSSPRERRLQELATLSQIALPQQELEQRGRQQRLAAALQLLGMQQEQQEAAAEQQYRTGQLDLGRDQLGLSREELGSRNAETQQRRQLEVLQQMAGVSGIDSEGLQAYAGSIDPQFAATQQAAKTAKVKEAAQKLLGDYNIVAEKGGDVLKQFEAGIDPAVLGEVRNMRPQPAVIDPAAPLPPLPQNGGGFFKQPQDVQTERLKQFFKSIFGGLGRGASTIKG